MTSRDASRGARRLGAGSITLLIWVATLMAPALGFWSAPPALMPLRVTRGRAGHAVVPLRRFGGLRMADKVSRAACLQCWRMCVPAHKCYGVGCQSHVTLRRRAAAVVSKARMRVGWRVEIFSDVRLQVREAESSEDFEEILAEKPLVFVEMFATKCRKCYALMGKYSQLASAYESDEVAFIKVACDKAHDIAKKAEVSKTPTFQVYVHGKKVDELASFPSPALLTSVQATPVVVVLCHAVVLPGTASWRMQRAERLSCLHVGRWGAQGRREKSQNKSNRWFCSGRRRGAVVTTVGPRQERAGSLLPRRRVRTGTQRTQTRMGCLQILSRHTATAGMMAVR